MLRLLSWNLARRSEPWRTLVESGVDVALVQEACPPPDSISDRVRIDDVAWQTDEADSSRAWRTAVVGVNPHVHVRYHQPKSIAAAASGQFAVSRMGTLAAADVVDPQTGDVFTVLSMYAAWERPLAEMGGDWIYADASAHRLVSDLSVFIGHKRRHRIIAAGDLNILFGHGEHGDAYWEGRYRTVFDRMEVLGLRFVGPQASREGERSVGRQADPWPDELPRESLNVPTYHTNRQKPATATRQLDFVFASAEIANRVSVRAMNQPEEWGDSDHCRVAIEVV